MYIVEALMLDGWARIAMTVDQVRAGAIAKEYDAKLITRVREARGSELRMRAVVV